MGINITSPRVSGDSPYNNKYYEQGVTWLTVAPPKASVMAADHYFRGDTKHLPGSEIPTHHSLIQLYIIHPLPKADTGLLSQELNIWRRLGSGSFLYPQVLKIETGLNPVSGYIATKTPNTYAICNQTLSTSIGLKRKKRLVTIGHNT